MNSNDLVVAREDILSPKPELVMLVFAVVVRIVRCLRTGVGGCVHAEELAVQISREKTRLQSGKSAGGRIHLLALSGTVFSSTS